jgi:hypothetical protein
MSRELGNSTITKINEKKMKKSVKGGQQTKYILYKERRQRK